MGITRHGVREDWVALRLLRVDSRGKPRSGAASGAPTGKIYDGG